MSIGVDPGGRAFRWQVGSDAVQTAYAVLGCPPYESPDGKKDQDEINTWEDPKAFRQQVCTTPFAIAQGDTARAVHTADLTSVEYLWWDLTRKKDIWKNAPLIVDAFMAQCPAGGDQRNLAFTVPNRLNEDAQDALLRAMGNYYREVSLLWRPIAIMLHWLEKGDGKEIFHACGGNNAVWVIDLDSAGMEFTCLTWRHRDDHDWIAPVRACVAERCGVANYSVLNAAWSEIFGTIPERSQLLRCQTAPAVQKALESAGQVFDAWVCANHRWRRVSVKKPEALPRTWQTLRRALPPAGCPRPQPGDVVLVHGWLACFDPHGVKDMLSNYHPEVTLRVLPVDAVAQGARFFAERRAANLPTYYDTLPEYRIWTSQGEKVLVAPNQEVEPGHPWQMATDDPIRTAFSINRHRDIFSMLVRRIPCDDPEYDYARRLRVGLFKLLPHELPLQLDTRVEAAKGNARFTVAATDDSRPFVLDGVRGTNSVTLTYATDPNDHAQGKETRPEPKHKGYLESQPVIGRIYDDPANEEMLKLLVRFHNGEQAEIRNLHNAIRQYRGYPAGHQLPDDFTTVALDRWGWVAWHNPNNQPTRGLFGTRSLPNREISELRRHLARLLWANGNIPHGLAGRNAWSKKNNYCFGNASKEYKDHIRGLLHENRPFPSWAEAYGPGFVLGDQPDDLVLFVNYCLATNFGNPQQAKMFWWSFFRMLCWHSEIAVDPCVVTSYLTRLADYLAQADLAGDFDLPRKNALFSILFALRVREHNDYHDFLMNTNDPLRSCLLQLINPGGGLAGVSFPPTMLAFLAHVEGNLSSYVARFIEKQDTVTDRELGSCIGTMQ